MFIKLDFRLVWMMVIGGVWTLIGMGILEVTPSADSSAVYPRAGWRAELSTKAHGVRGTAEIIDSRTIRLHNFFYDGGGPAVYAYLGTVNSQEAFNNGVAIGPLLTRPDQAYEGETLDLSFPADGPTLDGYTAISIWCVDVKVDFGSGTFKQQTYLPIIN